MKGWIYVLSNQSVPNWLAIGCSETDPETLVRQYGNSGIKLPYPFELQYTLRTPYPKSLLQKIHDELQANCVNPSHNQDWFECDLLRGIRTVRQVAGSSAIGETFYNQSRKLTEQPKNTATEYIITAASEPMSDEAENEDDANDNDTPRVIQQIRTVPEIKRGKRPSPIAPQVRPTPPPPPPPQPEAPPKPEKEEPKWLINLLIVVLACLLMVAVFLLFYLYGYI